MSEPGQRRPAGALRPLRLEVGIGAIVAAWTAVLAVRAIADNSFFTHLATGRLILDGGVPRQDPYSYTAAGADWVVQSWAASLLYAGVEDLAGLGGLRLLTGVLAGVLAAIAWRLTRPGSTVVSRLLAIVVFLATVGDFLSPRPLLMGLVAFAILVLAEESRWERAWPLAPLGLIWVNVHGSWPLGLVFVAVSLLGRLLDHRHGDGEGVDPAGPRRFGFLAAGIVVGGLVGLAGPRVLVFPIELLGRSEDLQVIIEWQSPSFTRTWARLFLVLVAMATLGLVRRPTYRGWLLWSVFVAAALLGLRNVPVAAIVLLPAAAVGFGGIGSMDARRRSPAAVVLVAVALVLAGVGITSRLGGDDLVLDAYPTEALEVVERAGLVTDPDVRLLAPEDVGNLIQLRHGTDARVFFDDRVDMYPAEVLDDYMVLVRGQSGWRDVLDRHEVDVVLWREDLPLTTVLDAAEGWDTVHEDDEARIFCRAGSEACTRF